VVHVGVKGVGKSERADRGRTQGRQKVDRRQTGGKKKADRCRKMLKESFDFMPEYHTHANIHTHTHTHTRTHTWWQKITFSSTALEI
jgi:hypothetical protein